jgi:hypothetical protein
MVIRVTTGFVSTPNLVQFRKKTLKNEDIHGQSPFCNLCHSFLLKFLKCFCPMILCLDMMKFVAREMHLQSMKVLSLFFKNISHFESKD